MEKGKGEEGHTVHNNLQLRQGKYFNINIMLNHNTKKKVPVKPVEQKPVC